MTHAVPAPGTGAGTGAGGSHRHGALQALRYRDFRLIAIGNMVSQMGTWVQYVALGWVARGLTSSPFLISLVFAAQWLPFLVLSPITGVVADRLDRRKIVLWGNLAMVVPALMVGLIISFGRISLFALVVLVILAGAAQACTQPAANAFVPDLVPVQHLGSAVALNAGLSSSTRAIGPAIGGAIISAWGVAWGFHVNAISFVAVAIACAAVRTRTAPRPRAAAGYLDGLRSGVTYLRANRAAMRIVVLTGSATFLMMHAGLISVMAKDVLHGDAGTYGLLSSGPGIGFIFSAVTTSGLTTDRQRTVALFTAAAGVGVALITVGVSRSVALSVAGMGLFGASIMTLTTVATMLLLATSAAEYRGRMMGLFGTVSTGMFTINSLLGGAIATRIGAPFTIWLCGAAILCTVAAFAASGTARVIHEGLTARSAEHRSS